MVRSDDGILRIWDTEQNLPSSVNATVITDLQSHEVDQVSIDDAGAL